MKPIYELYITAFFQSLIIVEVKTLFINKKNSFYIYIYILLWTLYIVLSNYMYMRKSIQENDYRIGRMRLSSLIKFILSFVFLIYNF